MTESKRGGARKGSGRKPKEPTTTINFRVPISKAPYLKPLVSVYIKELLSNTPQTPIETGKPLKQQANKKDKPITNKSIQPKKSTDKEPTKAELLVKMLKDRNKS